MTIAPLKNDEERKRPARVCNHADGADPSTRVDRAARSRAHSRPRSLGKVEVL